MEVVITQADIEALVEQNPQVKMMLENIALRRMLAERETGTPEQRQEPE